MLALLLTSLLTLAPADRLWLEAEGYSAHTGEITLLDAAAPDFGRMAKDEAGGGTFLRLPPGGALTFPPSELVAATYVAWVRAFAIDGRRWTVSIDGQPVGTSRGGANNPSLTWLRVGEIALAAGQHTVTLAAAEGNTSLAYADALYLTASPLDLPFGKSIDEVMQAGEAVAAFREPFDPPAGELGDDWKVSPDPEQWLRRVREDDRDCLRAHNGSAQRLELHLTKPLRLGPARQVRVRFAARRYGITEQLTIGIVGVEEANFNLRREWTNYERTFLLPADVGELARVRISFRGPGDTLFDELVIDAPDPAVSPFETGRFIPPATLGRGGRLFELERYVDDPGNVTEADVDGDGQWSLVRLERDANEPMFSRGTAMKSDSGATTPPLHFTLTGLEPGPYSVWTCDPGRPVTFQLDGGPEVVAPPALQTSLGQVSITDGKLGLTVKQAPPVAGNPGPAYLDYVLLIPTENAAYVNQPAPQWKDSAPDAVARKRIAFTVRREGVLGGGVALPQGELGDAGHVRAMAATGEIPCQTKVLCRWADGSIKWLFVVAYVRAKAGWIEYGSEVRPLAQMSRNAMDSPHFSSGPQFWALSMLYDRFIGEMTAELTLEDGTVLRPTGLRQVVEEAGPVRWSTRVVGTYAAGDRAPFSAEMLVTWSLGVHEVLVEHTFIASGDRTEERIRSLVLRLPTPRNQHGLTCPEAGGRRAPTLRLMQDATNPWAQPTGAHFTLRLGDETIQGGAAQGVIQAGAVSVAVDDFAEQYPMALSGDATGVAIELWPEDAAQGPFVANRGMAKTHVLRIGIGDPPSPMVDWLRFDPATLRQAGIFGAMPPAGEATAAYDTLVERAFDELIRNRAGHGMENWGDMFQGGYVRGAKTWSNQEWDLTQSWLTAYARTGDPRFLDFADATARHFADVDCIHAGPPTQLGGARTHCHTALVGHQLEGPNLAHAGWVEGLLSHYYLTGRERSLRAAVGIGRWTVQAAAGREAWGASGPPFSLVQNRPAGWPLVTLCLMYQQTRDPELLTTARRIADYMRRCQIPERGCWEAQTPHEEPWRGGCVFAFTNFRGLKLFAQLTGEARADQDRALAGRWLVGELWRPNDRYLYEQCPAHEPGTDVGFLQWETLADLSELTGDPLYLLLAMDGYEQRVGPLAERMVGDLARAQWSNGTMQQAARMLGLAERLLPKRPATVRIELPEAMAAPPGGAEVAIRIVNDGDAPLGELHCGYLIRGDWTATPVDAPVTIAPHAQGMIRVRLSAPPAVELVEHDNQRAWLHITARFRIGDRDAAVHAAGVVTAMVKKEK